SKKYGFGLPEMEFVLTILFSLAAMAFSAASIRNRRKDMTRFWGFSAASILLLLFIGLFSAVPILDRFKSFVPFCEEIKTSVPYPGTVYAYRPDETLKGVVPFYTGRFLKAIDSVSRLEEVLRKEKSVFVVVRDKREALEKELLSTCKMSVLFKQYMGTNRSLVVLRNLTTDTAQAEHL
ncbi:MAG: hypothetical protein PHU49_14010, partial [Syntrophorhabdaceae bacterium]|nr:hypothetical protein [Syntrophorhabdaceae bacterium]